MFYVYAVDDENRRFYVYAVDDEDVVNGYMQLMMKNVGTIDIYIYSYKNNKLLYICC